MRNYCLFMLLFVFGNVSAQYEYIGEVINGVTNNPVPFVNISIKGSSEGTCSDINGHFCIVSYADELQVVVSSLNIETDTLVVGATNSKLMVYPKIYASDTLLIGGKSNYNLKKIVKRALNDLKNNREKKRVSAFKVRRNVQEETETKYNEVANLFVTFDSSFRYLSKEDDFEYRLSSIRRMKIPVEVAQKYIKSRHKMKSLFCFTKDLSHHKDILYKFNIFTYKLKYITDSEVIIECIQNKDTIIEKKYESILSKHNRTLYLSKKDLKVNSIEGIDYLYSDHSDIAVFNSNFKAVYEFFGDMYELVNINVFTSNYTYSRSENIGRNTYFSDSLEKL
ncbi:MAG: carboxypeptidase-like regulatory domain-containing protein [Marinifilaceae bacterium]